MKKLLFVILISLVAASVYAADVGVSISIGQPGFYGKIDIGDAPHPEFINPQPLVARPIPHRVMSEPIYLRVPPRHQKHWNKYCDRYNACGHPVYFVRDNWYKNTYVPHYRAHEEKYGKRGHGNVEKHDRGHDDKHDRGRFEKNDRSGGYDDKRQHGPDRQE